MRFEEALTKMREGAKIRIRSMPDDEYYMACYISWNKYMPEDQQESLKEMKARGQSIVWIKGDKQHPDMMPKWNPYDPSTDPCKHGMCPQINLLLLMSDEWESVK